MKIGILTFHCAHNYGAVLQAYALQEYLKSCGHQVEIIDYRPDYLVRGYKAFPFPSLRNVSLLRKVKRLAYWGLTLPWRIKAFPVKLQRRKGFEKFINEKMNLSEPRFTEGESVPAEKYDAIIFGSDQIWSPRHTNGGDPVFLGNFSAPKGTLKIAYAASAGAASATLGENPIFADALKNFDAIGVRESNLAESLQPRTDLKIETVLDPTLLVDRSVWDKIAYSNKPRIREKYVLVYQVAYNPEADRIAEELAEQIGAKIVSIWAGYKLDQGSIKKETPEQFVAWFKNATCVVTTSFHGTAFALINEIPVYYVSNGSATENRPKQILGALGLEDRVIAHHSHPKFSDIDYSNVDLAKLQSASREFLSRHLKSNPHSES